MAITHTNVTTAFVRNALADLIATKVDTGAGTAKVRIRASTTTLVDIDLAATPFGAAASAVITAAGLPKEGTVTGAGSADNFQVLDQDGNSVFAGSVTATGGGGDMTLSSVTLAINDVVRINTFTYTAPP